MFPRGNVLVSTIAGARVVARVVARLVARVVATFWSRLVARVVARVGHACILCSPGATFWSHL
jgi:hypothetical protein